MIALTTDLSRRAAEISIASGEVAVNGTVVTMMGTSVDIVTDRVCLRGRPLRLPERFLYLAFYKPRRVLVTKRDPQGRHTIWEYLEKWKTQMNSAGRLDYDSEGLLLVTNDGMMLNALTHPRHELVKIYVVKVRGEPTADVIDRLKTGVKLPDGETLPARVKVLKTVEKNAWLEVAIKEGRNRQIRRMCDAIGHPVLKLKRVAVGPVRLGEMRPGEWRFLSQKEISELRNLVV